MQTPHMRALVGDLGISIHTKCTGVRVSKDVHVGQDWWGIWTQALRHGYEVEKSDIVQVKVGIRILFKYCIH